MAEDPTWRQLTARLLKSPKVGEEATRPAKAMRIALEKSIVTAGRGSGNLCGLLL